MDRSNFKGYQRPRPAGTTKPMFPADKPELASAEPGAPRKRRAKRQSRFSWRPVIALIILAGIIYLAYGYVHTKNQLEAQKNSVSQNKSQQLVDKVGGLVELPSEDTPVIFTVNDASKLKNQAFFVNAKDGDKVLYYKSQNQAILYRPSTNKIVEFSTVNLTNGTGQ